jgi:hypothetical protein
MYGSKIGLNNIKNNILIWDLSKLRIPIGITSYLIHQQ